LEALEQQPDTTRAGLAAQLGVAMGTVNWYLKRLIKKGEVNMDQLQRRSPTCVVCPPALALKAQLIRAYRVYSVRVCRELRQPGQRPLDQVTAARYRTVGLDGADSADRISTAPGQGGLWMYSLSQPASGLRRSQPCQLPRGRVGDLGV
jgi:hypothetical protein